MTNPALFQKVARQLPEAVDWLSPDNLRALLRTAGPDLATLVFNAQLGAQGPVRHTTEYVSSLRHDNTFFMAAWRLYCLGGTALCATAESTSTYVVLADRCPAVDLFGVLAWASRFAYTMSSVKDPDSMAKVVARDLECISRHVMRGLCEPVEASAVQAEAVLQVDQLKDVQGTVRALWNSFFSQLLERVDTRTAAGQLLATVLASSGSPVASWPRHVQELGMVFSGASTVATVDSLVRFKAVWARVISRGDAVAPGVKDAWRTEIFQTCMLNSSVVCFCLVVLFFSGCVLLLTRSCPEHVLALRDGSHEPRMAGRNHL